MKQRVPFLAALLVFGALLAGNFGAWAQRFDPNAPTTPTVFRPDTTERREVVVTPAARKNKAAAYSAKRTEHMFRAFGYRGIRLTRPGKAALLAALLPGAGQVYNHSYWKLPLVLGALGGTVAGEIFYQQRYKEFVRAIDIVGRDQSKIGSPDLAPIPRKFTSYAGLTGSRGIQFYRGNRDVFYLYVGIAYGLQIVDALVDAHLKDFDVSTDLSLHWEPQLLPTPGQPGALPTNPGVLFALRLK